MVQFFEKYTQHQRIVTEKKEVKNLKVPRMVLTSFAGAEKSLFKKF